MRALAVAALLAGAALAAADGGATARHSSAAASVPLGTIVYEHGGDLYSLSLRRHAPRRLTNTRLAESSPAFSPDGRSIAFVRAKPAGRGSDLWIMRGDGTRQRQLTSEREGTNQSPAWVSADMIVFSRSTSRFGHCSALYTIDSDGSSLRPVLDPQGDSSVFDPTVSPDGRRIAYVDADCEVRLDCCYIEVIDRSGRSTDDLRKLDVDEWQLEPAWSPGGRDVAFVTGDVDYSSIFVVRRDGSSLRHLTGGVPEKAGASSPAWSPDGRWIVFSRYSRASFSSDLYTVRADGSELRRLTRARGDERWPTWTARS